jgi:hypothetical protein
LYQSAREAFPSADVYVAATNDTSTRPFPFAIKEKLAKLAGVEPGHFVQVKSPFQALEITQKFNPEDTQLIFVRSQKDADKPPKPGGIKKNGEPLYLQPYNKNSTAPMSQQGYMAYLPTVEFGPGMTSATEIRAAWPQLNEKRKTALVMSLYPKTQANPKLATNVVQMLDTAIGTEVAEDISRRGFLRAAGAAAGMAGAGAVGAKELARPIIIAIVRIGDQTKQFNLGTKFDTSKQAEDFVTDFLNKQGIQHYTIELKRGYTNENQGWAATYEADGLTAGTGVTGGMHASYQTRYNQPVDEAKLHFTDPSIRVNLYYVPPTLQRQGQVQNVAHNIPYSTVQPLINRLMQKYPNMNSEYMVWYPLGQDQYGQRLSERDITSKLGTKRDQGKSVRKWRKQRGLDEQDYLDEERTDPIEAATVNFYQNKVGDVDKKPVTDYKKIARELLQQTNNPTMREKVMHALVQGNKNPYIQGGIITTVAAIVSGGILTSAARMGLTPQQTNIMLQAILNTVVPTVVSRLNGRSWRDTVKYTLASAGIGTGIAAMTETGRKK